MTEIQNPFEKLIPKAKIKPDNGIKLTYKDCRPSKIMEDCKHPDEDKIITESPEIIESANEILASDPVKYIIDTHQTLHVGDINGAKILLITIAGQSILNTDGLHPKSSGAWSKGKTHIMDAMLHLSPQEYVISSGFSDKSLYYTKLNPGMTIFMDDVNLSENMEELIKKSTTNFQKGTEHRTIINGKFQVKKIPPRISYWLSSVDNNQSMQLLSRTIDIDIDESIEQDDKVLNFQADQAVSGEVRFPENDRIRICRQILREIKSREFIVKIPYAKDIANNWSDKENRRNFPIFLDIIRAFTVLRFKQRKNENGYLIATEEDYKDANDLYSKNKRSQITKLTKSEQRIYDIIESGSGSKWEINAILNTYNNSGFKISQSRLHQILHGYNSKNGYRTGMLDKVSNLRYEKTQEKDVDTTTYKNRYWIEKPIIKDKDGWE